MLKLLVFIIAQTQYKNPKFKLFSSTTVLQLRKGSGDNLGIISNISALKLCCYPSSEPSYQDGSKEGSQHTFSLRNKKTYLIIFKVENLSHNHVLIMVNFFSIKRK